MIRWLVLFMIGGLIAAGTAGASDDRHAVPRGRMVADVRAMAGAIDGAGGRISKPVYDALGRVPRHAFVPERLRDQAYHNRPLPIGAGQTISQPYIVALMTELVAAGPGARILEIGTGSGYQAAMLAEMGADVFTIEIVKALGEAATKTLSETGYGAVRTRVGDGYEGWADAGPFDGIIVTAAPDHVPEPLLAQLKSGGRMVVPVGPQGGTQRLLLMRKKDDGSLERQTVIPVSFVPLTGKRPGS